MKNHVRKQGFALEILYEFVKLLFPFRIYYVNVRQNFLKRLSRLHQNNRLGQRAVFWLFFDAEKQLLRRIQYQNWPNRRASFLWCGNGSQRPLGAVICPPFFFSKLGRCNFSGIQCLLLNNTRSRHWLIYLYTEPIFGERICRER